MKELTTAQKSIPPWASGPGEILRHAFSLLRRDSDSNRRLAMLAIDNAVELTLKTFLGLPSKITGLKIPRKEYEEASESFPRMLDAIEKHAAKNLSGINLGEIEWYHRLRNKLYHDGNGLTVDREKVVVYSELARVLFKNLFGVELAQEERSSLADFLQEWTGIERVLVGERARGNSTEPIQSVMAQELEKLKQAGLVSGLEVDSIKKIMKVRNEIGHGNIEQSKVVTPELVSRVRALRQRVIRSLDPSVPHTLAEDFLYKRPVAFKFGGVSFNGTTKWSQVYETFLRHLLSVNPAGFEALLDGQDFASTKYFSKNRSDLRKPIEVGNGVFAEMNFSANGIRDNIKRLLKAFSREENEFVVYLREDRDALGNGT